MSNSLFDYNFDFMTGCNNNCYYCNARNEVKGLTCPENKASKRDPSYKNNSQNFIVTYHSIKYFKPIPPEIKYINASRLSDPAYWSSLEWDLFCEKSIVNTNKKFIVSTKRPDLMVGKKYNKNIWVGISCENQETFELRMESLRHISTSKRIVFFEPLEGPINETCDFEKIDWAIIGVMSGNNQRHFDISYAINLVEILKKYDIPIYIKSIASDVRIIRELRYFPVNLQLRDYPK